MAVSGWVAALAATGAGRLVLARRMELVARAAHELRAPLTAARLATELYLRGDLPLRVTRPEAAVGGRGGLAPARPLRVIPQPFRDALEGIGLELDRARLSLSDLAEAPHGRRAADRITTFDVGVLLVDAAEAWRAAARERGVRLKVDQPVGRVLVDGDRVRLGQACGNLLANAIEHGSPADDDGEIVLRARAGLHTVRIEVLDAGPGLPAPVPQLVRRRPRGGRRSRGRGLAIAADIAARHRGRLAVAPTDQGARMVLELPTAVAR
ncbi:HAMP domain-containing sensor histidine kinase [Conexibacter sp. JD483]|uniref:sensor histidine kinase n=1 Tax=unclassified Conexibacter TaxID=2627773 RepID=UPI002722AC56|nr:MULTISPECIES: HAMP domain-containing sensor histidine kinase [unclassified Conexibacter]MDO8184636.1 HAMP domain-containing sensor histidine kinase [Conexibacter sp. CPCC 205706]MDO8197942.1 HAMP domain-containing sensor histidine kinase [Conexibacter sp. CPCC 205762]MDR9368372.1 HAMP domain-containing sensor histidine kinase [Conexibacter sp. JD483]